MVMRAVDRVLLVSSLRTLDLPFAAECISAVERTADELLMVGTQSPAPLARMFITKYSMAMEKGHLVHGLDSTVNALELEDKRGAKVLILLARGKSADYFTIILNAQFRPLGALHIIPQP